MEKILAWHFTDGPKTRNGQSCEIGKIYTYDGPLELCKSGLHASIELDDALKYAPGDWLWRVECDGDIVLDDDKLVCRERKIIAGGDAAGMLWAFARSCALDVIHLWDAPPVVVEYLTTGEESIRAAARAAARDSAWYIPESALYWSTTGNADLDAVRAIAGTARVAAWYAAGASGKATHALTSISAALRMAVAVAPAAMDAQRKRLATMSLAFIAD